MSPHLDPCRGMPPVLLAWFSEECASLCYIWLVLVGPWPLTPWWGLVGMFGSTPISVGLCLLPSPRKWMLPTLARHKGRCTFQVPQAWEKDTETMVSNSPECWTAVTAITSTPQGMRTACTGEVLSAGTDDWEGKSNPHTRKIEIHAWTSWGLCFTRPKVSSSIASPLLPGTSCPLHEMYLEYSVSCLPPKYYTMFHWL